MAYYQPDFLAEKGKEYLETLGSTDDEKALLHYVETLIDTIKLRNAELAEVARMKREIKAFLGV